MSPSRLIFGAIIASPGIGRAILRAYLRAGGPVPDRYRWLVDKMMLGLVPNPPGRTVRLTRRAQLAIDLGSATGRAIYYHGSSEPGLARFLGRTLKPGMTVVDAGANLGEFTARSASLVGSEGRVLAIEASPETAELVERNIRLNGFSNVRLIRGALCEDEGSKLFHLGRGVASGSSSLTPPHDDTGETVQVPGVRLDRLRDHSPSRRIDLVKLDIEGAELESLRGATALLGGPDAPIVVLEFHPAVARRSGWNFGELRQFLGSFGYRLGRLAWDGTVTALNEDPDDLCNVVAAPGNRPGAGR